MNDKASYPGNPAGKRTSLPRYAALALGLLRTFWMMPLALLIVVFVGMRSGWTTPRQWSDGFFVAASVQVLIAAMMLMAPAGEALDASWVRYMPNSNVSETRHQLLMETLHKKRWALASFIGGALTFLIAEIVLGLTSIP